MSRVVVTGGIRGIGEASARRFKRRGHEVFVSYRSDRGAASSLAAEGISSRYLDVTDDESILDFRHELEIWGRPDVLVNNAGVAMWKSFMDHSMDDIRDLVRVNVEGAFKIALMAMELGVSRVVNVGSGASKSPYENLPVYCATKAALRMLTFSVGEPMILVNPGMTKTRMTNFKGEDVGRVADIVVRTALGDLGKFGQEVDVRDHI